LPNNGSQYYKIINPGKAEVLDEPNLDGRTCSLEVGNRPVACNLKEEEEEEEEEEKEATLFF
jgi:hypothetical protein